VASQSDGSIVGYRQAFRWAASNFFPLLWTSILSGLAIIGGTILFVIPGIALSIYLYFSVYAVATGTKYGPSALKKSYQLVKGRWWAVTIKLFTMSLWLMLLYLIPVIIYAIAFTITTEDSVGMLVTDVILQGVFGGVIGVMAMYALAQYYKYLQANPA
jgi:hypothetical protein